MNLEIIFYSTSTVNAKRVEIKLRSPQIPTMLYASDTLTHLDNPMDMFLEEGNCSEPPSRRDILGKCTLRGCKDTVRWIMHKLSCQVQKVIIIDMHWH
jgi:hypothetical protein